jgi:hypothetical protein
LPDGLQKAKKGRRNEINLSDNAQRNYVTGQTDATAAAAAAAARGWFLFNFSVFCHQTHPPARFLASSMAFVVVVVLPLSW